MGRVIDCAMALITGAIRMGNMPPALILGADLAGVALIIVMMALNGDFNLAAGKEETRSAPETPPETAQEAAPLLPPEIPSEIPAAPETPPALSPEETLERMRARYDLTQREAEVLRELVLTEDKQAVISERLKIQVKTLQDYVTRLYRKTGVSTRAGLTDLYHESRNQT